MKNNEPKWLSTEVIETIHSDQIKQYGGDYGIRDAGLLESALARPKNKFAYQETSDLFELAAAYGYGIAKNHPFVDGNKRTAFLAMAIFLGINKILFNATEQDVVKTIVSLATGKMTENQLSHWLKQNSSRGVLS